MRLVYLKREIPKGLDYAIKPIRSISSLLLLFPCARMYASLDHKYIRKTDGYDYFFGLLTSSVPNDRFDPGLSIHNV
jgi:hypothetical protein